MTEGSGTPRLWIACVLGFVGFVTSFGAHIVAVNLPVYAEKVGFGVAMIGLLIAAYDLAEIVAKPVFGFLADRQGMKRTMLIGIAIFTLASLLYLVVDARLLLLVRFLQGVGAAALSAVSLALVGVYFEQGRGRAFGVYNLLKGAGYVVSPLVGGYIVTKTNFAAVFVAAAAVGVLAFLLSLTLPRTASSADLDDDDDFSWGGFLAVVRDRALRPWYAVIVANMFFVGILFGFLPVRVHALGYSPFMTGLTVSAVSVSYLLVQPLAGHLADRMDASTTIRVGLVLAGLTVIAIPFVSGVPLIVVAVLAGLGVGTVWTNTDTVMSSLAAEGRLGQTMGMAGSFKELGDMVGPLLIGVVAQAFGLTIGFVVCGALGLASVLLVSRSTPGREGVP